MPTPESVRICLGPPPSMSLFRNSISFLHFGRAGFPLDADVNVLGVFAEDDDVHALGMFHGRRHALEIAHRAHAGVEVENLAQRDVQRANAAAHRSRQRPLDRNAEIADGFDGFVRQPLLEFVEGFFAGEDFEPRDLALAAIDQLDRGVEHAPRRLPDVAARAVALDEGNDGIVGDLKFAVGVLNGLPVRGTGQSYTTTS